MTDSIFQYQVYKNAVPVGQIVNVNNMLSSNSFAWFLSGIGKDKTVTDDAYELFKTDSKVFESAQLCHVVLEVDGSIRSHYKGITDYLLEEFCKASGFKLDHLLRVKINLQLRVGNIPGEYNTPHTDFDFPHYVLIYYVNSADSPTTIFKQKNGEAFDILEPLVKIPSEEGTFVLFDGLHYHAGMHPKDSPSRMVINFCLQGTLA
jgi:hypothetical protein